MPKGLLYGQKHGFEMQEDFPGERFGGHQWVHQGVSEIAQEECEDRVESAKDRALGPPNHT